MRFIDPSLSYLQHAHKLHYYIIIYTLVQLVQVHGSAFIQSIINFICFAEIDSIIVLYVRRRRRAGRKAKNQRHDVYTYICLYFK